MKIKAFNDGLEVFCGSREAFLETYGHEIDTVPILHLVEKLGEYSFDTIHKGKWEFYRID